ncbi:MAG: hypothetical protein V7L14_04255 [Nostoc sp.]|uniref:hypothetical protein n=1 Tax=Nostoc sp. TaxID=1180 RepID=UPI002FF578A6
MIYFSSNRFDANIQDFSSLLDGDSLLMVYGAFAAEVEIFMLLIAAYYETTLRGRRCLDWATPTRRNYKFLYYTY